MKRSLIAMAAFVSVSLLGCGLPTVDTEAEELEAVSQELVTCTATCSGGQTVSCTGTTCSATEYQGVTCDGVFTSCSGTSTCLPSLPTCDSFYGKTCKPAGTRQYCCDAGSIVSYCICSSTNKWLCV